MIVVPVATKNYGDYKIIFIYISGYGPKRDQVWCKDGPYPLVEKIRTLFMQTTDPKLAEKEKVFFVQVRPQALFTCFIYMQVKGLVVNG